MKDVLLTNIVELIQVRNESTLVSGRDLDTLPSIANAYLHLSSGKIQDFGTMDLLPQVEAEVIDLAGKYVMPAFVDSHTHLVFAGPRESEFVQKIRGVSYQEIAAAGGGILNSAALLRSIPEELLLESALQRARQIINQGTGTVEIKSGYGLTLRDELKMLRVAKKIGEITPLKVKTTFLGAHAVPKGIEKDAYINLILEEMIPQVASENLAQFIDVFCEDGFFSYDESVRILNRGKEFGLVPKVHANQLNLSGGIQAGVATNAISVDHLETVSNTELELLENSNVIATLLPGAAFFLGTGYPPVREMLKRNIPVSVASDFNPGSSPTGNMQTIWSLATIGMKMTPKEAFNAMTVNAAAAMQMEHTSGIIKKGRSADLIITKEIPSFDYIPYSFGENCISEVILDGKFIS